MDPVIIQPDRIRALAISLVKRIEEHVIGGRPDCSLFRTIEDCIRPWDQARAEEISCLRSQLVDGVSRMPVKHIILDEKDKT